MGLGEVGWSGVVDECVGCGGMVWVEVVWDQVEWGG